MKRIQNLIIGAGPAGLATAGRMRKAGIPFEIIEQSQYVGNAWRNHYDRLHLHTVKQFSNLPHLEFPKDYPLYVPRAKFVEYLNNYAQHFKITPTFGETVTQIKKGQQNTWEVHTKSGKQYEVTNVVIASGINRIPNIPTWKGQDDFQGTITHSVNYKNAQPYIGKKVLMIGMGNTGAELAFDLSEYDIPTYLSVRGPVNVVPRDLNGRPVQVTSKQLEKLPFGLGDWLGSFVRKLYYGDLSKYGIQASKEYPVVQLKKTGKTPVIDIGTIKAVKAGKITIMPDISHFTATGVHFVDGRSVEVDAVVLATGFRAKIEDFVERGTEVLDKFQCPKAAIATGFHQGLHFVGFDNYKLGGILGTIFTDSETVVKAIAQQ